VVTQGHSLLRLDSSGLVPLAEWMSLGGEKPSCLAVVPGTDLLIAGTDAGGSVVFERRTGEVRARIQNQRARRPIGRSNDQAIPAIAASSDGALAATAAPSGEIDVWKVADGSIVRTLAGASPEDHFRRVAFRPKGRRDLTGVDGHGQLRVWTSGPGAETFVEAFPPAKGPKIEETAGALIYSPDGTILVQAGLGQDVVVWDAQTGARLQTLAGSSPMPTILGGTLALTTDAAFSGDGRHLATCGTDGAVRLWDVTARAAPVPAAVISTTRVGSYRFVPVQIPGSSIRQSLLGTELHALCFRGDGRRLLVGDWNPPLYSFDLDALAAELARPPGTLGGETERRIGIRVRGEKLEVLEVNRLVPPAP
jgi:WD40 repeat protein